jgi:hypothetical protein
MKLPTFSKAEDPLEAEAWIKAIEAKFSAFVMPCSEENKANFAALQLRGEAKNITNDSSKVIGMYLLSITRYRCGNPHYQ